ncbi:hypothetical protein KAI65_06370 [Candidatus Parcubacteria bacterium]|nr:hypothetical protein [Candidatus Parcubacteria bacterium]
MDRLNKITQIIFLVFFAFIIYFGAQKAYSLGAVYCLAVFALLTLIPVLIKDPNILKFKASFGKNKNIAIEKINTAKGNMEKVIKSNKSDSDKIQESQKLIDEAFGLGYKIGSGRIINNIQNVKFTKNKDGKITDVQFDEN